MALSSSNPVVTNPKAMKYRLNPNHCYQRNDSQFLFVYPKSIPSLPTPIPKKTPTHLLPTQFKLYKMLTMHKPIVAHDTGVRI